MEQMLTLKTIADETRMKIVTLLLQRNYCVKGLAWQLEISGPAVSQHVKVLCEAGLLTGKKQGYFMHYDVNREALRALARELNELADTPRGLCTPEDGDCPEVQAAKCHNKGKDACPDEVKEVCVGPEEPNKTERERRDQ